MTTSTFTRKQQHSIWVELRRQGHHSKASALGQLGTAIRNTPINADDYIARRNQLCATWLPMLRSSNPGFLPEVPA